MKYKSLQDIFKSKLRFEEMRFWSNPNRSLHTKVYFDSIFLDSITLAGSIIDDIPVLESLIYFKYRDKWVKQWLRL